MPIKIDFIAKVSEFVRGTKQTADALDDVADALDDVVRDGDDAERKMDRNFREIADAAKDVDRRLDDVGTGAKRGFGKAADAGAEFKDETLANVSEVASSFDGSFESIGDVVQGTLGGVTQALGPALGGAAAAAAAGVGVITDAFTKAGEAAEAARQSAFKMAYDVQGALDAAGYSDRISEWTTDTEKLKQATDIATVAGWEQSEVIDALASGGSKLDDLWDAFETGASTTTVATGRALELEAALKATQDGYLDGGEAAKLAAKLNYDYATSAGKATEETDDLGNKIYELPDGKTFVVNAKTQTAYEDLDALERKQLARKNIPVGVTDYATAEVDRIVRRINGKVASIQVTAGIGGRSVE